MKRPTRQTRAGRAYLDLQKLAREDRRPTDELLQLYVLEGFLDRLIRSGHAERLVLKGGILLAAYGVRRPTRDIDFQASVLQSDTEQVKDLVCDIANVAVDDGIRFDTGQATAEAIREADQYPGIRVSLAASLATARLHFHVDINVGDPMIPPPTEMRLPRLLGGELSLRSYPLAMIHAEKIVTAIARGTANTRWRDFADIYFLSRHHPIDGATLTESIHAVAKHRAFEPEPLATVLAGYPAIAQRKWLVWCRKQWLVQRLPEAFQVTGCRF